MPSFVAPFSFSQLDLTTTHSLSLACWRGDGERRRFSCSCRRRRLAHQHSWSISTYGYYMSYEWLIPAAKIKLLNATWVSYMSFSSTTCPVRPTALHLFVLQRACFQFSSTVDTGLSTTLEKIYILYQLTMWSTRACCLQVQYQVHLLSSHVQQVGRNFLEVAVFSSQVLPDAWPRSWDGTTGPAQGLEVLIVWRRTNLIQNRPVNETCNKHAWMIHNLQRLTAL